MLKFGLKFGLKLGLLVLAVVSAVVLWQQTNLSILALSRIDPLPKTRAMVSEERYAEAANYLNFFMEYDYVSQNPKAQSLDKKISDKRQSWTYKFSKLSEGLLTGTSDETIGKAAGVATDFFVIGDIRDLTKQGYNFAKGEEVDKVLVSLSTLGVIATTAQVASGAGTVSTYGAAAPAVAGTTVAKSGVIALKAAKKMGKLPSWLGKTIVKAAKSAKNTKSLGALTNLLGNVNTLAKTRGGFTLISQAKNAADLRRMAKFAKVFGSQSATIYRIGGKIAIDVGQRTKKLGKETIKLATTFGKTGLKMLDKFGALKFTKIVSRGLKITYKGDFFKLLARLLLMIPTWILYIFVIAGAAVWAPWRMLYALKNRLYHNFPKKTDIEDKAKAN